MKLTLLLTVTITLGAASTCSDKCKCGSYPVTSSLTSATCFGHTTNFTMQLPNTTTDLTLIRFNNDEFFTELKVLTHLTDLTLIDCEFKNNFSEVSLNLVRLYIKNCELDSVPNFAGNNTLELLDLSLNKIEKLPNGSLDNFAALKVLNMSSNNLRTLSTGSFAGLTNLHSLDLSQNDLQQLPDYVFEELRNLAFLNLSNNKLDSSLDDGSFHGLIGLNSLDLSRNNLRRLHDNIFEELGELQFLNLSNNKLEDLRELSLNGLVLLQQLDLTGNSLKEVSPGSLNLPCLTRLFLSRNSQLGNSNFVLGNIRKLRVVEATDINLRKIPAALNPSIRSLRIANNEIKYVRCGDFDSYPLLQLLDLTKNYLEFVEDDALGRLDTMSILYLTWNKLSEIPGTLPERLQVLHLEFNLIKKVSNLGSLPLLEVLLLNDNKIEVVSFNDFKDLTSLVTLDLSRNPIKELQPGAVPQLQILRLNSLELEHQVNFPLITTESLVTLDLSQTPILAKELLSDTAALASCRELQELNLNNAQIEVLPSDLLHYLPQLRVLNLNDNKLNCTDLQWLAKWLRSKDDVDYKNLICATPLDLYGTPLVDLQYNDATSEVKPRKTSKKKEFRAMKIFNTSPTELPRVSSLINSKIETGNKDTQPLLHPGMLILALFFVVLSVVFVILKKFKKNIKNDETIEVNSLSSVTELW